MADRTDGKPLLVCDANILIDLDAAELIEPTFDRFRCAVPDFLFAQELALHHRHLKDRGLEIAELAPAWIARMVELSFRYRRPSRNDLAALVLAEAAGCLLLTGDRDLRAAATGEGLEVHGTLWLVEQLILESRLPVSAAEDGYARMARRGRRLPSERIAEQLVRWRGKTPPSTKD